MKFTALRLGKARVASPVDSIPLILSFSHPGEGTLARYVVVSTTAIVVLALVGLQSSLPTFAHPLAPALLDLREQADGRVDVTWKTSALQAPGAEVVPELPAHCAKVGTPRTTAGGDSLTTRWAVACGAAGLAGARIALTGLDRARIDVLVRVALADGQRVSGVVRAAGPSFAIPARARPRDVLLGYVRLGFMRIAGGLDHLLFVGGLLLLGRDARQRLAAVIAFSAGHSVSLAAGALGLIVVPEQPTALLIALSTFVLAAALARGEPRPSRGWRMAGPFGLLHGLGFASGLSAAGLPAGCTALALLAFNLGIELGQVGFIAIALGAAGMALRPLRAALPRWIARAPLYAIGSLAAFGCFTHLAALLR